MNPQITAIGTYTPEQVLTNKYMEQIVDTSDEWITKRTGIKERRKANGESTVDMACEAAEDLKQRYNKEFKDVDFIIFASSTAEHKIPSLASQLQERLGIQNAGSIDLTAACAGFVYALTTAKSMIISGMCKKILIVTSELLTRHTDYTDRSTCILFGDAASVAIVEPLANTCAFKPVFGTEGENGHVLYLSQQATELNQQKIKDHNLIVQDGRKVFKWAVQRMSEKFMELLNINALSIDEIDWFIPHSANLRIIEGICSHIGLDRAKALESLVHFGNTSAVTIPLALNQGLKAGKIKPGDKLLLLGFGGGLTFAGTIVEWMV